MVYTPGNKVCCCRPPFDNATTTQRSLRRLPQVKSDITGYSLNPALSHSFPLASQVQSGRTDVFVVNLAELYLLPLKLCVMCVSTSHFNDITHTFRVSYLSGADLHHTVFKIRFQKPFLQQSLMLNKICLSFTRASHSLQSSQAPQIHLLLT